MSLVHPPLASDGPGAALSRTTTGWAPDEEAPFVVTRPAEGARPLPLVFASPHSGRIYPAPMMSAARLDAAAVRRSEDAYVDQLIAAAPAHGVSVIAARLGRAFLDVNREAWELDPSMFEDELPPYARVGTARVAAGLGSIARVVGEGEEIYRRKLRFAEAQSRVRAVHAPYHAALAGLLAEARRAHGLAVLIDWHSMPAAAAGRPGSDRNPDMVLGDRFGRSASPAVSRRIERELMLAGYRVARNIPYAGGYTTEHHGRPERGVHAVQIEVNRALYLDEDRLAVTAGFDLLRAGLERFFAALAAVDWTRA